MCSGRGKCDCGRCKCDSGEFSGKYCEECPTCPGHRCEELRPCVECFLMSGEDINNCSNSLNCSSHSLALVASVREDLSGEKKMCTFLDETRCTILYQYYDQGDTLNLEIQKEKVCPEGPDVLGKSESKTGVFRWIVFASSYSNIKDKCFSSLVLPHHEFAVFLLEFFAYQSPAFRFASSIVFLMCFLSQNWSLLSSVCRKFPH